MAVSNSLKALAILLLREKHPVTANDDVGSTPELVSCPC
jgi:hypothetical protein